MNQRFQKSGTESPYRRANRAYEECRYGQFLTIIEKEIPEEFFTNFLISRIENLTESQRGNISRRAEKLLDKYVFG